MAKRPPGERSRWLPGDLSPWQKGVYERSITGFAGPNLSHFDGRHWHIAAATVEEAMHTPVSGYQHSDITAAKFSWRGLAAKP